MGTGKSKTILDSASYLYCQGEIDGLLIASDKGSYLTWVEEVEKHLHPDVPRRIAHWSSRASQREIKSLEQLMIARDDVLDIVLVNIEALSSDRAVGWCERFLRAHYAMMVVDEATSIKNPRADRTKACCMLANHTNYRRIATGTPITNSPLDLFGMCQFLKPGLLGFQSFVQFRSYFANIIQMSFGSRQFPKIIGYQHLDELTMRLQQFSSRVLKSECLDLPEKVYEVVHVELSPEQRKYYDDLRAMAILQFDQGLLTSTSALTTINKLQQICCGHVKIDDGTTIDIPCSRVSQLIDILESLEEKVVIWCAFQRDVQLILSAIHEKFRNGLYPVHYYGMSTEGERWNALENFSKDHKCRWFVGTAATGGKGINVLVAARYCVYYSNTYSLEDRLQSEDRLHRIGQTRSVTYIDLSVPGTVDDKIGKALRAKRDLARSVLDDFRSLVEALPF